MTNDSKTMFEKIRAFLTVYMPKQRGLSNCTIDSYRQVINQFLGFIMEKKGIPYDEISFNEWNAQTISDYLVYLKNERNVSASTRNQRLFAIRSFLKYARISNPEVTVLSLEASGIAVAKESKEPVVFLSENAIAALLRQPDDTTKIGLRDMCFMITMYDTAARDCEMLNLRLNSLDLQDGSPKIRLEGKGNKVRYVPLMKKTVNHLKRYIKVYHSEDAREEDWLFYTVSHGTHNKMSDDNVARFLKKYTIMAREVCDEMPAKVTPHQFRHTRAMHLYRHGMPLQLLAEYMGHASVVSTQIYAYADTEMKRRAIEKCQGGAAISAPPEWQNNVGVIKKLYGLA